MLRLRRVFGLAVIGLSLASAMPAAAQPCGGAIANGDLSGFVPSNATGGGWTSRNIDAWGGWRSSDGNPGALFILNAGGQRDSDPCIETLVTGLCPGRVYTVSGDFASYYISQGQERGFECRVAGRVIYAATAGPLRAWRRFEGSFVATAPEQLVQLCGECNGTDDDMAVDNISVAPTSFTITTQPRDQAVGVDQPVTFFVEVFVSAECPTPSIYQWQRRDPAIADENAPNAWIDLAEGGRFVNTAGSALVITQPTPGLATGYRCRISSVCSGQVLFTNVVTFSVACPADFNADGGVDFGDVEAFFERWENGC
jgi:hypothetical protein